LGFSLAQAFLPETSWLAALAADTGLYDLVYTSFALHHLSTEQKAEFFRRVAQRLEKDGLLLLTDIVREEDESLPVYLRRYCDWLRSDWGALNVEEKASACDHILNNDRPETFSELRAQAQAAGLEDAPTYFQASRSNAFRNRPSNLRRLQSDQIPISTEESYPRHRQPPSAHLQSRPGALRRRSRGPVWLASRRPSE
jgi:AdoMet dependent proline di-methyltransferase